MTNTQLSLLEQAQEASPGLSDPDLIRTICEKVLTEAEIRPPVNVELLASLRGIAAVEEVDQDPAGILLPAGDRLLVRVRASDSPERRRFTVLHEAGHTLLPGFSEETRYRCNGEMNRTEKLCDIAASELLFPRKFFGRDASDVSFDLSGVEELAALYEASIEATARRLIELSGRNGALLVFTIGFKPSEMRTAEEGDSKLRLKYSFTNGKWPFLRRMKSVDDGSPFQRALDGEIVNEVGELGDLCARSPGRVSISARRYGREGRVIAVVERLSQQGDAP